jgi:hypothetical protein
MSDFRNEILVFKNHQEFRKKRGQISIIGYSVILGFELGILPTLFCKIVTRKEGCAL